MRKKIEKIISYAIVALIFYFLLRGLLSDWQSLEQVEISFYWPYFLLSSILFLFVFSSFAILWREIYHALDADKRISAFNALKIYVYSQFGKYLPGKAWAYVGMVYLGEKEGLRREIISASLVYEIVLSAISAFVLPFLVLGFRPELLPDGIGYFSFFFVAVSLICLHPAIFYRLFSLFLKITKMNKLPAEAYLSYRLLLKIFSYFLSVMAVNGIAFYFFANTFFFVPWHDILYFAAFYILASALGMVALFAPGGLGVKEGLLTLFIKRYLFVAGAVFVSIAVRIWLTLIELAVFGSIYFIVRKNIPSAIKNTLRDQ